MTLGRDGRDFIREILRRLHGRGAREHKKIEKNWALKLETTDMEFDAVEREVEEVRMGIISRAWRAILTLSRSLAAEAPPRLQGTPLRVLRLGVKVWIQVTGRNDRKL